MRNKIFAKTGYLLIMFLMINFFSQAQDITLTQQIMTKKSINDFCQLLIEYSTGKAESRIILESLMETRSNKVCNDLSNYEMIEFNEYLNLILQQKPTISFSEIPPKEQWQVASREDGWIGIVVKINKKVNNADKVNYFVINPANNKIVNIYKTLPGFLSYGKLTDVSPSDNQISEEIKVSDPQIIEGAKVADYDGNVYKTIIIGTQVWMAENLQTTHLSDGSPISNVKGNKAWSELKKPGYCWYENDKEKYNNPYGALYNWHTVSTDKLCPTGWHVPSDAEWGILEMSLGMSQTDVDKIGYRGTTEGAKLKALNTIIPNKANNSSGFTALVGGLRSNFGNFDDIEDGGYWWSSTAGSNGKVWYRELYYNHSDIGRNYICDPFVGFSVRCLKD